MWPLHLHYNGPCPPPQGYMKGSEAEGRKETLPLWQKNPFSPVLEAKAYVGGQHRCR